MTLIWHNYNLNISYHYPLAPLPLPPLCTVNSVHSVHSGPRLRMIQPYTQTILNPSSPPPLYRENSVHSVHSVHNLVYFCGSHMAIQRLPSPYTVYPAWWNICFSFEMGQTWLKTIVSPPPLWSDGTDMRWNRLEPKIVLFICAILCACNIWETLHHVWRWIMSPLFYTNDGADSRWNR